MPRPATTAAERSARRHPASSASRACATRRSACWTGYRVVSENARVNAAVEALRGSDLAALGRLLDDSHASLRDLYDVSTPAVEAAVEWLLEAGAAGARVLGGGFGGHVLGLMPPEAEVPIGALEVRPGPGARLVD